MYIRFKQAVNTHPTRYLSSELPDYPEYYSRNDMHPYITGQWSVNEPFPCSVPLYATMAALKAEATKQRYIQPVFICPGLGAACEIFYRLKTVEFSVTFEYCSALGPVKYTRRTFNAAMKLRHIWDRIQEGDKHVTIPARERETKWTKEDPLSCKLNPYYVTEGKIEEQPMPGVGPPIGTKVISRYWCMGDYYSDASYDGHNENTGFMRILGVVKIKDTGEYGIIGNANFTPFWPDSAGNYIGRSPGYVLIGIEPPNVANYTTASTPVTLSNRAKTTIYTSNSTERRWSQPDGKYVDIHSTYSSPKLEVSYAQGRYSPFL